jgi:uncharacterized protein
MSLRPPNNGRRLAREDFFKSHTAEGALRQPDRQRAALVSLEFLSDLQAALAPDFGHSTHHLLYCTGFDWGLRDLVRLGQRLRDEAGGGDDLDLWQREAGLVLDSWWAPLDAAGWGGCTFSTLPHSLVLADVTGSAFAAAADRATAPVCHLTAGLLAGALSFYERAERHAVEVQCTALGHATCQFVIGASPHIDTVEKWQHQHLSADEIQRRLAALPHASA